MQIQAQPKDGMSLYAAWQLIQDVKLDTLWQVDYEEEELTA